MGVMPKRSIDMRKRIIAGNWKMNKTVSETKEFVENLKPLAADAECDVVLCVPFVDVAIAAETAKGTNIHVGAQNVHWANSGAFTGEISASMLKCVGAEYVIIGHSERRAMFGETDETVCKRLKAALEAELKPIVCIGETLDEREGGKTQEVLARQVKGFAEGLTVQDIAKIVVAYEPVWAIGTGKTATTEVAVETVKFVRDTLRNLFGEVADTVRIQYGGSMNGGNAGALMSSGDIDGGLIGGASLKTEEFIKVIKA